jgi:hypothetical protein
MPQVDVGGHRSFRVLAGRYRLVSYLARGGMAEVWEGHDALLARPVAVKLPLQHLARQPAFLERFRREAVSAARLTHPNVVAIYDTGVDRDDSFIVMELVNGLSLRQELVRDGRIPPGRTAVLAAQVADALDFAHRSGLVHRDVKPANILIAPGDIVKVTDFGIAKAAVGDDFTQTDVTLGTARYISPEQVEGHRPDGRSDVYSLGVVLFEMLCGRTPFEADTELALALKHVRESPPRPTSLYPDVPPWLEDIVLRALAKDPVDRFASAGEMQQALLRQGTGPGWRPEPGAPVPLATYTTGGQPVVMAYDADPSTGSAGLVTGHIAGAADAAADQVTGVISAGGRRTIPEKRVREGWWEEDRDATWPPEGDPGPAASDRSEPRPRRLLPIVVGFVVLAAVATAAALVVGLHRGTRTPGVAAAAPPQVITPAALAAFDPPPGDLHEDDQGLPNLLSTAPGAYWQTEYYANRQFGNLKSGVGFYMRLASSQRLGSLSLQTPTSGWSASIYLADSPASTLADWGQPVASQSGISGQASFDLHGRKAGAVLVWITELGPDLTVKVNGVRLVGG